MKCWRGKIFVKIEATNEKILFDDISISKNDLKALVNNERRIYALIEKNLEPLSIYDTNENAFYQLVLFENNKTPTIEISGIHMHRTVIDPLFDDAKREI